MKTEVQPDTVSSHEEEEKSPPAKRRCRRDSSSSSKKGKEGQEGVRPDEISSVSTAGIISSSSATIAAAASGDDDYDSSTTGKEGQEGVRPDEISSSTEDDDGWTSKIIADAAAAGYQYYDGPDGRIAVWYHRMSKLPSQGGKTDLMIISDRPNKFRKWVAMESMKEHYQEAIEDYAACEGLVIDSQCTTLLYDGPYGKIQIFDYRMCPLPSRSGKTDLLILVYDRPNEERKWVAMESMQEHYQRAIKEYARRNNLIFENEMTTLSKKKYASFRPLPDHKKPSPKNTTTSMDNLPSETNKEAVAVKTTTATSSMTSNVEPGVNQAELGYETVFQFKIDHIKGEQMFYHVQKHDSWTHHTKSELEVRSDMSTGESYIAIKNDEFWQKKTGLLEYVVWPDTFARATFTGEQDELHFYEGYKKEVGVVGSVSDMNEMMKYFPNLQQSDLPEVATI